MPPGGVVYLDLSFHRKSSAEPVLLVLHNQTNPVVLLNWCFQHIFPVVSTIISFFSARLFNFYSMVFSDVCGMAFVFSRFTSMIHDIRWAPPQVRFFEIPTYKQSNRSRTATAFRTFCHASKINFLQQPVHACPAWPMHLFPENFCNKRRELQFFSWRETLISARPSLLIFLILNKTIKICHLLCLLSFANLRHFVFQGWFKYITR